MMNSPNAGPALEFRNVWYRIGPENQNGSDNALLRDLTLEVQRGETLVRRIRRQKSTQDTVAAAETTVAKAKTTRTQASKASTAAAQSTWKRSTCSRPALAQSPSPRAHVLIVCGEPPATGNRMYPVVAVNATGSQP